MLAASHTPIIPPILQLIPIAPALVFDLFKYYKPSTDGSKRVMSPEEHSVILNEFERDLKRASKVSLTDHHVEQISYKQWELGSSSSHQPPPPSSEIGVPPNTPALGESTSSS